MADTFLGGPIIILDILLVLLVLAIYIGAMIGPIRIAFEWAVGLYLEFLDHRNPETSILWFRLFGALIFFGVLIPVMITAVWWRGLVQKLDTDLGILWGISVGVIAYIGGKEFIEKFLTGIALLLSDPFARGNFVSLYNSYGKRVYSAEVMTVGTHSSKFMSRNQKIRIMTNEELSRYVIKNHDMAPFHQLKIHIPILTDNPAEEGKQILDYLGGIPDGLVHTPDTDDAAWFSDKMGVHYMEGKRWLESQAISLHFNLDATMTVRIPVKNYSIEEELSHLIIQNAIIPLRYFTHRRLNHLKEEIKNDGTATATASAIAE